MLANRRQSGERSFRRTHYLKGTLRCFRCKSRLGYCVSRGNGGSYAYFFCLGRHHRRTACDLPHLRPEDVEAAIVDFYLGDQMSQEEVEEIRSCILEDLAEASKRSESDRKRLMAQITAIRHERKKLAEKSMAEVVPPDIARDKQRELSGQLLRAEGDLQRLDRITADAKIDISRILELAERAAESYRASSDELRREWNFARYEALEIDVEVYQPVVRHAARTPVFEALATAEIPRTRSDPKSHRSATRAFCHVRGSTVELLVEAMGLEPTNLLTASQALYQLSYAPSGGRQR